MLTELIFKLQPLYWHIAAFSWLISRFDVQVLIIWGVVRSLEIRVVVL